MRAREGDFIETTDGLFFDVKGLLHPPDRIVAYLRYFPDNRGTRSRDGVRYVKVYDLAERRRLLEKRWPHYLYQDEVQGRELQGVPKDRVRQLYTPHERLTTLLRARRKDRLEACASRFVNAVAEGSGLRTEHFGISGSLLVSLHRQNSDLDIIIYGTNTAERVQQALFTLLGDDQRFHAYRTRDLHKLYLRRDLRQAITFNDFELQERRKVFQGKFLRHDYFIRCVKDWEEISERYGETRYAPIGKCTISAQVNDDTESSLTPCRYLLEQVEVLAGDASRGPREIVSFRGRFAEQARVGERVFARGRLEAVRSRDRGYFRLVVGEGRTDVMRTIW